jgi:hypothetical protein
MICAARNTQQQEVRMEHIHWIEIIQLAEFRVSLNIEEIMQYPNTTPTFCT